ncbi:hypothetical protein WJX72_011547 [[Myrmecia] bisecta]|uniref:Secreted protein n=1 Tax=[Myrmecia] bisecta TaxID=41462 RepID=A0AAW1PV86_9CHLO
MCLNRHWSSGTRVLCLAYATVQPAFQYCGAREPPQHGEHQQRTVASALNSVAALLDSAKLKGLFLNVQFLQSLQQNIISTSSQSRAIL